MTERTPSTRAGRKCPNCGYQLAPVARMTLSLPGDLVAAVRAKATAESRTVSSVIEEAVRARRDAEEG